MPEMPEPERRIMRSCDEARGDLAFEWAPSLTRCPWSQIESEAFAAIQMHSDWTKLRCLPFGGDDLMAQPAYIYEAIKAVEAAVAEVQAEQACRAQ